MNVVRLHNSSRSGICQKPQFASTMLKIVAPAGWASVTSLFGSGWTSHSTLPFSCWKSAQIMTAPDGLGKTTIFVCHCVCSSTGYVMLKNCMQDFPPAPFSKWEWACCKGCSYTANYFALGLSCMTLFSLLNVLKCAFEMWGNWSAWESALGQVVDLCQHIHDIKRKWIAGEPNKLCCTFRSTKKTCVHCLSLYAKPT